MRRYLANICVLLFLGMILFIALGIVLDSGWFFIGFLACLAGLNIIGENEENRIWNNGICAHYNEPWQFIRNELHTETTSNVYQCRDKWFSASPRDHFRETYKGR